MASPLILAPCRRVLTTRKLFPKLSLSIRRSSTLSESPASVIKDAIASLNDASNQLMAICDKIQAPLTLETDGQKVSFKDLILHSRDAHPNDFHSLAAQSARHAVLPIAEAVESDLKKLSNEYTSRALPSMQQATRICQETPCGGASWEVDFSIPEQVKVEGMETPCGRLQTASMDFLKLTFETKKDVILASRAALIVRLAMELNAPLTFIRQGQDEEAKTEIGRVFQEQVVPTPWLRSDEEYKQLLEIEKDLDKDQ